MYATPSARLYIPSSTIKVLSRLISDELNLFPGSPDRLSEDDLRKGRAQLEAEVDENILTHDSQLGDNKWEINERHHLGDGKQGENTELRV